MALGLGVSLGRAGVVAPGIVTTGLALKQNFDVGEVVPISDGAAFFDGSNDYINCGSDSSLDNIFDGGGTLSAWILPNSDGEGNEGRIIDKRDDGTGYAFHVISESSGKCELKFYHNFSTGSDTDLSAISAVNSITISAWNHVAITYDSSDDGASYRPTFYINGILSALSSITDSAGTADTDALEDFIIGTNKTDNSRAFDGYICNVGVWTAALTQAQIKSIMYKNYSDLTTSETTNLVSWWNLSADANDNHGSNNGTLS